MKFRKNTILILLFGLLLMAFASGMAQTPAQGDQKKKADACCSMESCCCNGDSCPMKKEGATNAEAKDDCCSGDSCCGDSCDMKAKHDTKNHGAEGDCCNMKHKNAKAKAKQKAA
jgi:hypothetical protein